MLVDVSGMDYKILRNGEPNYLDNSPLYDIQKKYATSSAEFENIQEAKKALLKDLLDDKTGIYLFFFTCFANSKLQFKYDFNEVAQAADAGINLQYRKPFYQKQLLELYLASLEDEENATEKEIQELVKYIPTVHAAEFLECVVGYFDSLCLTRKHIQSVIAEYYKVVGKPQLEELDDQDDQLEELE